MSPESKKWVLSGVWVVVALILLGTFTNLISPLLRGWVAHTFPPTKLVAFAYATVVTVVQIGLLTAPLLWIWRSGTKPQQVTMRNLIAKPLFKDWVWPGMLGVLIILGMKFINAEPDTGTSGSQTQNNVASAQARNVKKDYPKPSQAAINFVREADALEKRDKADYAGQLRIARLFVSRDPTNDFAWSMLGRAHEKLGENAKALEAYAQSIKLDPSALAAWEGRARLYIDTGDFDRAEQALKRITELEPDDTDSWVQLGIIYHVRGDRSLTISVYQKLRTLDPTRAAQFFEAYVAP